MISSEIFWNWFYERRRIFAIAAIIFVAFLIYINQTLIIITTSSPSDTKNTPMELSVLNKSGKSGGVLHIGSVALIARDAARIEAKINNWQTTVDITPLPWIGIKEIKLDIERDRNVDKLSGKSLGCSVYDEKSGKLASYTCGNPTGLYEYQPSKTDGVAWKNEALVTFPGAYTVAQYGSGLLGIENSATPRLFYADMISKNVALPALPQGFTQSDLSSTSVITDSTAQSDHFLLVNTTKGTIYFASKSDNSITYQKYSPDKKWLTGNTIKCVLRQVSAYCFIGGSTIAPDSAELTAEQKQRGDGHFVTVNFGNPTITYTVSTSSKDDVLDELYIDDSKQLYGRADTTLYSLDTSSSNLKRTIVSPSVSAVSGGQKAYYITNNQLFEFDSKTKATYLRFSSKNIRLSTINQVGSRLFMNAFINGAPDNTLHTYELLSEQNTTPGKRLVDLLPVYPNADQTSIISMDYYKDTINITLPNYVNYDARGNLVPYDTAFNESKREAVDYLSTLVPDIKSYTITYARASN